MRQGTGAGKKNAAQICAKTPLNTEAERNGEEEAEANNKRGIPSQSRSKAIQPSTERLIRTALRSAGTAFPCWDMATAVQRSGEREGGERGRRERGRQKGKSNKKSIAVERNSFAVR